MTAAYLLCSYGLDLFLLSIDEGISGYRDDSLETVKRNEQTYGIPLKVRLNSCQHQQQNSSSRSSTDTAAAPAAAAAAAADTAAAPAAAAVTIPSDACVPWSGAWLDPHAGQALAPTSAVGASSSLAE